MPASKTLINFLLLIAFLVCGLFDSMSAAHMMTVGGADTELNSIMRHVFMAYGEYGLIMLKLWTTGMIIGTVKFIHMKSRECISWMVAGFLLSLTLGGILATLANMSQASGMPFPLSSFEIMLVYGYSILVTLVLGDMLDTRDQQERAKKLGNDNE